MTVVEACVGSLEESVAAEQGGAGRLELCHDLSVGGITPATALLDAVKERIRIPVSVMIRPRGGSFVHSADEISRMLDDIDLARMHGADMLVFGVLTEDGAVDVVRTGRLVERAGPTPVTFHKAFDQIDDQMTALEALIDVGVARVLTSGGAATAIGGVDRLAALVERAAGRIGVMAGGKVRADSARELVARAGVAEVHARCELDPARIRGIVDVLKNVSPGAA